jgi:hypothetical protein
MFADQFDIFSILYLKINLQKKEVEKELEEKKRQTEEEEKRIKEKIADDEKSL